MTDDNTADLPPVPSMESLFNSWTQPCRSCGTLLPQDNVFGSLFCVRCTNLLITFDNMTHEERAKWAHVIRDGDLELDTIVGVTPKRKAPAKKRVRKPRAKKQIAAMPVTVQDPPSQTLDSIK